MGAFVSVIIPTLNEEKYLEPTLQAIKSQNYGGDYETIVSDSGSEDGTLEIAEKYADMVVRAGKRGIGAGRNAGAKEANGEILFFVDADTVLLYNTLFEVVKRFEDRETLGVAIPVLPLSPKVKDIILFLGFNEFVKINVELGQGRARVVGSCSAYRRSAFDKVGGFNEEVDVLEDFDLSERVSKLGKIEYTEETMALVSTRRIARWGRVRSVEKYLSLYLKHLFSEKGFKTHAPQIEDYQPIR
ncbi:glycosyltransferase [[Eubacterium] cellulosolvens]